MTDIDPELAARLRDLADARVRAEVARAEQARQTAADARTAQARRRRYGVNARNSAREARIRLTQHHDGKDDKP
jgi:hypothetical protein